MSDRGTVQSPKIFGKKCKKEKNLGSGRLKHGYKSSAKCPLNDDFLRQNGPKLK